MTAAILTLVVLSVCMLIAAPRFAWIGFVGCAVFTPLWWAMARLHFAVWSGFDTAWNQEVWLGRPLLGVPVGEVLWAVACGAAWAPFMAWCLEMRPADKPAPVETGHPPPAWTSGSATHKS